MKANAVSHMSPIIKQQPSLGEAPLTNTERSNQSSTSTVTYHSSLD
jgi:hypothetical protein